jgi:hypothetical protein
MRQGEAYVTQTRWSSLCAFCRRDARFIFQFQPVLTFTPSALGATVPLSIEVHWAKQHRSQYFRICTTPLARRRLV